MAWNESEVSTLKKMWADGYSCGQIAKALPEKTRNAVIGKITRMGLVRGAGNARLPKAERQQVRSRQKAKVSNSMAEAQVAKKRAVALGLAEPSVNRDAPKRQLDPSEHKGRQVGLLELERGECKFPTGYEGEHLFCGEAADGHTYCQHHRDFLEGALKVQRKREAAAREAEQTRLRNGTSSRQRLDFARRAA